MYTEIYQAASVLFAIILAGLITHHALYWKRQAADLQKALHEAWNNQRRIERLREVQARNKWEPEDWSLRGKPAKWEDADTFDSVAAAYSAGTIAQVSKHLSDEQLAAVILTLVQHRFTQGVDSDKVFTRLAGRIFRVVEKDRKEREVWLNAQHDGEL